MKVSLLEPYVSVKIFLKISLKNMKAVFLILVATLSLPNSLVPYQLLNAHLNFKNELMNFTLKMIPQLSYNFVSEYIWAT